MKKRIYLTFIKLLDTYQTTQLTYIKSSIDIHQALT